MKVYMTPHLAHIHTEKSGIVRVIEAYFKYLPDFGVELVNPDDPYDLRVSHAASAKDPDVVHTHGLYWTADYRGARWEWAVNSGVIAAARQAREITVPSEWVAESFQRDMRISPHVIPHGIEWDEWQEPEENRRYILWNKNRIGDVCDPQPIVELAKRFGNEQFVMTFAPHNPSSNIREIGLQPHTTMKRIVKSAGLYLSTTKETFGIGTLEAMASGVPILGFAFGGNLDLVKHGVNGYLARPGNFDDLAEGFDYCFKYRETLGKNGREMARQWRWEVACEKVLKVYELALEEEPPTAAIIIPSYNYANKVGRAIESAINQDYKQLVSIIVVDDGSNDEGATADTVERYSVRDGRVHYIRQDNAGVAVARNRGIAEAERVKYVCCLDADDAIEPDFLTICVDGLERDRSLGITYTGLKYIKPDGEEGVSPWPGTFNYERQLQRQNQIPTCCVFRKKMWERLGGYRKRYCPQGAGAEDAEFWTRCGAYGWNAAQITSSPLFIYSLGSGYVTSQLGKGYKEVDWLAWHPWSKDGRHPFASIARPQNHSHPVRQYDDPIVSVIIPVGPGHDDVLLDALDSLEAQTLRQWEAIVVIDGAFQGMRSSVDQFMSDKFQVLKKAYPYVNWLVLSDGPHGKGAGLARNFGADHARSSFLLFLDADDYLMPTALEKMVDAWKYEEAIIYSDYVGIATVEDPDKLSQEQKDKLYYWENGKAVIGHQSFDYSSALAQKQPHGERPYIWTNVTSLIPKEWHDEIGGFDETMKSWEDVDYHWRMARAGKCYIRIPEELLAYRFDTGTRREYGRQEHAGIVEYLRNKYKEIEVVACNCSDAKQHKPAPAITRAAQSVARVERKGDKSVDEDLVRAKYLHPNRGQHRLIGGATKIDYGYRAGQDIFLIHKKDIASQPHLFQQLEPITPPKPKPTPEPPPEIQETPAPSVVGDSEDLIEDLLTEPEPLEVPVAVLPEPEPELIAVEGAYTGAMETAGEQVQTMDFDFQTLPGVTNDIARQFEEDGIKTLEDLIAIGAVGLQKYVGIAKVRGEQISKAAEQLAKAQQ